MPHEPGNTYIKLPEGEEAHTTIREQFNLDLGVERQNREDMEDDLKFSANDQWSEEAKKARNGLPCLTVNMTGQYVRQVTGDIRLNKPAVKVSPVDSDSDPETAELYTGLIRNIEQQSNAQSAYITAADNAARCGQGHFRINLEYADDDSFDLDIRVRRIRNAFAVVWDRNSEMETREDANHCFVMSKYGKEEFKAKWPKAAEIEWPVQDSKFNLTDWTDGEQIVVCEYWYKKPKKRRLAKKEDGSVVDVTDKTETELAADDLIGARFRDVDSFEVVQRTINGIEDLEEPYVWPGRHIPILSVMGEEIYVADKVVRQGLIRVMKDAQRMYNYNISAATERAALSPKAPFIGTEKQFAGNESKWALANRETVAYLSYTADPQAPGPPQRSQPPDLDVASMQLAQNASDNMSKASGIYPSSLGQQSNETSGKAIIARERQGDVGTFLYIDNLARTIGYCGKQLVDLIPKIYDAERVVRILGEDDSEKLVTVNQMELSENEDGTPDWIVKNDLTRGKYDAIVTTGPSFSTKRQEAAESMMQFIQTAPALADMVMDLIAKNMDWPGADEFVTRFRKKLIAQGVVEPEDDEEVPEPPPPSPEDIEAQTKAKESEARIGKLTAEAGETQIDAITKMLELALKGGAMQQAMQQAALMGAQQAITTLLQTGAPAPPGPNGLPSQETPL